VALESADLSSSSVLPRLSALESANRVLRGEVESGSSKLSSLELQAAEAELTARAALLEAGASKMTSLELQAAQAAQADAARAAREAKERKEKAQSIAAAAKSAAESAVVANVPTPVAPPTPTPAPVQHHNYDAVLAQIQKVATGLENLSTRVALLETRPVSSFAPGPATGPVAGATTGSASNSNSGSGSGSGSSSGSGSGSGSSSGPGTDPSVLGALEHQSSQTARQLAATVRELGQIQSALAALEKVVATKASAEEVQKKAASTDLASVVDRVDQSEREAKDLADQVQQLKEQLAALQDAHAALASKLAALAEASSCSRCHEARPSVRCSKCSKSFCDECDEAVHGSDAEAHMQAHLRTPFAAAAPAPVYEVHSQVVNRSGPGEDDTRRWAEDMFNMLARKEKATRGDIHELYTKDKELRAKLTELLKANGDDKRTFEEIMAAIKKLETELRNQIANTATTSRNYTDNRIEELLIKLRELERALEKGMKSELKRFERDVLVFMESNNSSDHAHGSGDASVGKIHFRCLSCDQHVGNLQGPSSLLYARAVGQASMPINPNATNMKSAMRTRSTQRSRNTPCA
jgi:hypothetical protein